MVQDCSETEFYIISYILKYSIYRQAETDFSALLRIRFKKITFNFIPNFGQSVTKYLEYLYSKFLRDHMTEQYREFSFLLHEFQNLPLTPFPMNISAKDVP